MCWTLVWDQAFTTVIVFLDKILYTHYARSLMRTSELLQQTQQIAIRERLRVSVGSFCTLFQLNLRSCDGSFLSRDRVGSKKFLFSLWLCHSCYDRYSGAETSTIWNQLHSKLWNISLHSFIDIMLWDRAQSIFHKQGYYMA